MKQNVPNPVNSSTTISYYLPDNTDIAQIKITDAKGRLVKTFNAAKGEGQINIRSNELPAGTYNYTLYISNKTVDAKQMVLIKWIATIKYLLNPFESWTGFLVYKLKGLRY